MLWLYLIDMMIMLYYLKKNNINHEDIKEDNIMFSSNTDNLDHRESFKIIDFSIDTSSPSNNVFYVNNIQENIPKNKAFDYHCILYSIYYALNKI